jgi:hypothetical protein
MHSRSLRSTSAPLTICALTSCVALSSACVRARKGEVPALIPMVSPIPVAPGPVTTTLPTPSVTRASGPIEAVPPVNVADEVPAASPPAPPAPTVQRVVLADELPYRWSREKMKDASDRPPPATKRRGRRGRPYHPAPGIIVDVTEAQGGAAAAEMQRSARNVGYWPFRRCYEEGLRRDQSLAGKVSVDLSVAGGGAVERTTITSATLRDESVVLCIGREASRLALSPGGGPPTEAKMQVTLATGDALVPVPQPVPRASDLREALRASWPAVTQCYASSLAKHTNAGGRLELLFRTKSNGEIVDVAEEGETRFADVDVTRCVLGVYRTSKLSSEVCSPSFSYAMHFEASH